MKKITLRQPERAMCGISCPALILPSACLTLLFLNAYPVYAAPADTESDTASTAARRSMGKLPAAPDTPNIDTPIIGQIVVIGNHRLSETAIILASGFKIGDPCTEDTRRQMRDNLLKKGEFGLHSATVEDAVKVHMEPGPTPDSPCKVVIEVDENDVISTLDITGIGPIKIDEIYPLLHLKPGMIYNPVQFRRDFQDIQDLYNRHGYAVTPSEEAGFDNSGRLNLALIVTKVAGIQVVGLHKTHSVVVLRQMKLKPNAYFNNDTMMQDRLRLLNLGLFETVEMTAHNEGPGKARIVVQVQEKKVGSIQGGFTYGAVDQLVGDVEVADHNLRGLGETIGIKGELGSNLQHRGITLNYRQPWLDSKQTQLDLELYDRSANLFADPVTNVGSNSGGHYTQQHEGVGIKLGRPLGETLRGALTLRAENTITNTLVLSGANQSIIQDGPIYTINSLLERDTRDLASDPVRGSLQSLTLGIGHADLHSPVGLISPTIFGSSNYGKTALDSRFYLNLAGARRPNKPDEEKRALALHLLAGSSLGRLPFTEQYFLGGADSLRGYREQRFWGSNMFLSSLEFRQPVIRHFQFVAFMDVGEAWGGDYSNVNLAGFAQSAFQPHVGSGVGLRVSTPLGKLRLDLGVGDEGARIHVGFGNSF